MTRSQLSSGENLRCVSLQGVEGEGGGVPHKHCWANFWGWKNLTKKYKKNAQRPEESIGATFTVQTRRIQKLSPKTCLHTIT
jgi:hypothetical protein